MNLFIALLCMASGVYFAVVSMNFTGDKALLWIVVAAMQFLIAALYINAQELRKKIDDTNAR